MNKRVIYILGLVTLLIFPIPTFIVLWFLEGVSPLDILQLDRLTVFNVGIGLQFGIFYAFLALLFMQAPVFDKLPGNLENIIRRMKLSFLDCLLLSICAGVGEELLFRSGVQYYLGPILTSVLFVAIHGYLNPKNWRMSLYGILVLPFIIALAYGFYEFGLWFSIAAHFAYDLVVFRAVINQKPSS